MSLPQRKDVASLRADPNKRVKRELHSSAETALPFGYCGLTLAPCFNDADAEVSTVVATRTSGRLYSRDALVAHLARKSEELKARRAKEEDARVEQKIALENDARIKEALANRAFIERETVGMTTATGSSSESTVARSEDAAQEIQSTISKYPPSPISGKPIRFSKDVVSVELIQDKASAVAPGEPLRYLCAATRKPIVYQRVVLLVPSKQVLLKDAYDKLGLDTVKVCPVTDIPFDPKRDVIELIQGVSRKP